MKAVSLGAGSSSRTANSDSEEEEDEDVSDEESYYEQVVSFVMIFTLSCFPLIR